MPTVRQCRLWTKGSTVWTQFDANKRFTWWDCKLDCSLCINNEKQSSTLKVRRSHKDAKGEAVLFLDTEHHSLDKFKWKTRFTWWGCTLDCDLGITMRKEAVK
jgi:sulfatase maturation enzyme AslB (radical SAM superfamily)